MTKEVEGGVRRGWAPNARVSVGRPAAGPGFARPTVLILVPNNVAGRLVRGSSVSSANRQGGRGESLDRLAEDFEQFDDELDDDEAASKGAWVPEDHAGTFRGNVDDHFRLGSR